MRYPYNLQVFYVSMHTAKQEYRPATLFTQRVESGHFTPRLADIRVFENTDAMFSWLLGSTLLSYEQMLQVYNDLNSTKASQVELFITPELAANQIPPLQPEPGEVIPSEQFLAKMEAWKAAHPQNK